MLRLLCKILPLIFLAFNITTAQTGIISGRVTDDNDLPLIGANVIIENTLIGASTNDKGEFKIGNLNSGQYRVVVTMIGYSKYISDKIEINDDAFTLNIILKKSVLQMDQVVVSASKYEQEISRLPVSASVVDFERISEKNFNKLDDILRYVPGVQVTLDQVSIRGSSGYSRGAGTRVLVAVDGIPLYTGDSGEIVWEVVPTTDMERVEIVKGASSSLYGSTALGGVVNIITKKNTSRALTFIKSYLGAYDKPAYNEWNWSNQYRMFNGLSVSHSNKIDNLSFTVTLSRTEDMSYRENDWQKRYAGYLKTKYNFNPSSSLTFLATGFYRDRGTFTFWKDLNHALVPPDEELNQRLPSDRFLFGMIYDQKISGKFSLTIKPSLYRTFWKDQSESLNRSSTNLYRTEIQTIYYPDENLVLTSGIEGSAGKIKSNIFGNQTSKNAGIYSQLEYTFPFPLIVSIGARYDLNKLSDLNSESCITPKIGFNYKFNDETIIRLSMGKGFRAPTLAEAFTSTSTTGIRVKPNPNLKSETSYSAEAGIKKDVSNILGIDAAIFWNEYFDFIEPGIDPADGQIFFNNVTRARIQGTEISTLWNLDFINSKLNIGYTYLWARDVNQKRALRYRPRNMVYLSFDYNFDIFELGADFRYWSKIEEIDVELVELGLVKNGDKRVEVKVLDLRGGINLFSLGYPARIYINLNNIFNYNYVEIIGNISPIRNISLNLELLF